MFPDSKTFLLTGPTEAENFMESLGPECTKLKQKYEACFYQWYSEKYLTGKSKEDECAPLFKEYRNCLEKYLKEKKIDTMLEDHLKKNLNEE